MKPEQTRDEVLRAVLVERVEQSSHVKSSRRRGIVALAAAFVAGALVAGGGLSATALVRPWSSSYDTVRSAEAAGRSYIGTHDPIVGEPFELVAAGGALLVAGSQPVGATALVVAVSCVGEGGIEVSLDRNPYMGLECDPDGGSTASYAGWDDPSDSNEVAVHVTRGSARFSVWAAWVLKQEEPEPSSDQAAALADGVVTRDEYLAGFERYASCMLEAGFDVAGQETPHLVLYTVPDAAVQAGTDMACYVAEFRQLDIEWQIAHQEPDDTQQ